MKHNNLRGILFLLTALLIFSIQDVIIKLMSSDYAVLEIVLIRSIFALPFVLLVLRYNSAWRALKTRQLRLELLRGLMMFLAYLFFFLALAALPYSLSVGIFFSGPLFITALSVPLLQESVGWQRWLAVLVGFVGVLIIVDPGGADFEPATILALASACTYAIGIILTRKMDDSAQVMAVYTASVYLVLAILLSPIFVGLDLDSAHPSLVFLTKDWTVPLPRDLLLIFGTALCWGVGMLLLSTAYRDTEVALLAPFEYFAFFYGLLFGYLVWREVPTLTMMVGVVLIIGSGLFIVYRENRVS